MIFVHTHYTRKNTYTRDFEQYIVHEILESFIPCTNTEINTDTDKDTNTNKNRDETKTKYKNPNTITGING